MKNKIKAWFGRLIGIDFCEDCGRHLKPMYQYCNNDGDQEFCFNCVCGLRFHLADHEGM